MATLAVMAGRLTYCRYLEPTVEGTSAMSSVTPVDYPVIPVRFFVA